MAVDRYPVECISDIYWVKVHDSRCSYVIGTTDCAGHMGSNGVGTTTSHEWQPGLMYE